MINGEQIVLVEFFGGAVPFNVQTQRQDKRGRWTGGVSTYDVEWCRRDVRLYGHLSGFGGGPYVGGHHPWWAASGVELEGDPSPHLRLERMPLHWTPENLWGQVCDHTETEYCTLCDDYLPTSDGYEACEHLFWCDECGTWTGPGYAEGDRCEHVARCSACNYVARWEKHEVQPCDCRAMKWYPRLGKEGRWVQRWQERRHRFTWKLSWRLEEFKRAKRDAKPYDASCFPGDY